MENKWPYLTDMGMSEQLHCVINEITCQIKRRVGKYKSKSENYALSYYFEHKSNLMQMRKSMTLLIVLFAFPYMEFVFTLLFEMVWNDETMVFQHFCM